ncbi:DUF4178 domain-containing protein [Ramlibacter sp. AN1133]|uniref:DUF4178 domain-containing protein n=1 Tax=Ramlibacter sp. AN1133 TaxID=3133429 RepID=UPI0030BC948C
MTSERTYTAPCPGCGAAVEFRSAQSTHAVCSFCRSTVVRDGATLARIGKVAERFEDFSPLQLLARGRWQGRAFTLVGRLQYRGPGGAWTEWNCLFEDDGSGAWLAEDNGGFVFALPASTQRELPPSERFRVGATTAVNGKSYQVTSSEQVALVAAEGELPKLPPLDAPFAMVELRSPDNEVLSVDYGSQPPALSRGRPATIDELQFTGLKQDSARATQGRQFACPHCGAPVQVQFGDSKAITCGACDALIDLTQGVGGELRHALQDEPVQPLIPLGSTGQLQGVQWQVVGFQHRLGTEPEDPDEHFGWNEYLLYNRKRGFAFLVDASDGWSMVKTATGAPKLARDLQRASYLGTDYRQQYAYKAQTTYVAGEFYWPVERGQLTFNRDYAFGTSVLSMEETPRERTWSVGSRIDSDAVASAFGLTAKKDLLQRGDAGPLTPRGGGMGCGCGTLLLLLLLILVLVIMLKACEDGGGGGSGYRSGGSFGGVSGGAHK